MSSLTSGILSQSLLELLELSESNDPGLISIPDIINKMQRTMKKLKHLRTRKLSLVFTCNLCISGHQSDLFTFLVYFLVSASLPKKCTSINNGVILVSYNKSRLKQATSVMFNILPFLHRACNSVIIRTDALSILIYFDTHQVIPVFCMYKEERQSVNKSSSPKKTTRFISSTLTMCKMN